MQKSHEKNVIIEDTHRRNEANMRRKQINPQLANSSTVEAPPSPASTGAMDTLLEKLRAAAPQTRDTRDRRRRARLKDKHQVRVASGQKMPDIPGIGETTDENGLLSPTKTEGSEDTVPDGATSEGEDIADRAASMLQGLRGDSAEGEGVGPSDSLRVRRRRESADGERTRRRQRRAGAGSTDTPPQSTIVEEPIQTEENEEMKDTEEAQLSTPPTTVVVPPSPTASEKGGFATPEE